jgi:hypothetical protein
MPNEGSNRGKSGKVMVPGYPSKPSWGGMSRSKGKKSKQPKHDSKKY